MVDVPTFPLYRLPYVALKVAFDCSHPNDIIRLSMVSKKSYSICKVFRRKMRELQVRFDQFKDICSDCMPSIFSVKRIWEVLSEDSELESLKIKNTVFQVKMDECIHTLNFYSDDRSACLITLCEYLTDFYEIPLYDVTVEGDRMTALNEVLAIQETLPVRRFYCSNYEDQKVEWFLSLIENRATKVLVLDVTTNERFRLNLRLVCAFKAFKIYKICRTHVKTDCISFGERHTLSIDNFSELNCRCVFAVKTSLTCGYLNAYLKNWQIGVGNPNLGCLELGLNLIDVNAVLNDLGFIHTRHPNKVYYAHVVGFLPLEFRECYEIKKNDGTIASIIMEDGENAVFKLCVWPDVDGKDYPKLELAAE